MGNKKYHKNITAEVIILYEDTGLTEREIAFKLNIPLKQVQKIINENCNFYDDM